MKRYQDEYAVNHIGDDDSRPSESPFSLWDEAEKVSKTSKKGQGLTSAYNLYRKYQRETLSVCRKLWTKFNVPNMIEGIAILSAAITLLAFYARGLQGDRTYITGPLLLYAFLGIGIGGITGSLLSVSGLISLPMIELSVLMATAGSILGGGLVIFRGRVSSPFPNSLWGWLAVIITVSQSIGFASNSYTIWEDEITLFFLTTFGVISGASSMRQKTTSDRVLGVYHSILFIIFGRISSLSRLCREEQMPYCQSTYYSTTTTTSSTFSPWQLIIPVMLTLLLPAVIRAFYAGSKSYDGTASLYIGVMFRFGLFAITLFWTLEAADNYDFFLSIDKETLKSVRVFLSQFVLALALIVGMAFFIYSKPCVTVSVNKNQEEKKKTLSPSTSTPRTTVTILGYGNVYGTHYFFLLLNICLCIILLQKPMGQGTISLLLWQILSLLEILDTNGLTISSSSTSSNSTQNNNNVIGPIILGLLGSFHFFKTGHQATLSSIQWESAFIPLSTVKYPWSPILVIINTFGAQILVSVAIPLTVLWKRPIEPSSSDTPTEKKHPLRNILTDIIQAITTHLLYLSTINLATTLWAGHLRRHLMLYRIFSPRFMMGAAVLGVVDFVVLFVAFGGVRWSILSVVDVFGW